MSGLSGVRRRIPRYPVAIPVDITVLRSGTTASIPGRSLDLGEGGVAAVLAAELQLGEWVGVQFQLPNAAQALQTKAVVRHHNQLRCGFEFQGLSADQPSMIRSWAGMPLKSMPEPPTPVSVSPSTRLTVPKYRCNPGVQACAPPGPPARTRALERLLLTWPLLGGGAWAGWVWYRGWEQLEERMARKDAHAQAPSAKVPAEVMERLLVRRSNRRIPKPHAGRIFRAWSFSTQSSQPTAPW